MSTPVIGWREWVDLPDWGARILAKIDTGAKSSSIDATGIKFLDGNRVSFQIRCRRGSKALKRVEAELVGQKRVRSSNGETQERVVVKTTLIMAGVKKEILINLSCRKNMMHRMLLGRTTLEADFLIDVSRDGKRKESSAQQWEN